MTESSSSQFGMIGLGVMGANLALNVADHGFTVAVWNREWEKAEKFCADNPGKHLVAKQSLQDFVQQLERPRRIMLMIKAGAPADAMIEKRLSLLPAGGLGG